MTTTYGIETNTGNFEGNIDHIIDVLECTPVLERVIFYSGCALTGTRQNLYMGLSGDVYLWLGDQDFCS